MCTIIFHSCILHVGLRSLQFAAWNWFRRDRPLRTGSTSLNFRPLHHWSVLCISSRIFNILGLTVRSRSKWSLFSSTFLDKQAFYSRINSFDTGAGSNRQQLRETWAIVCSLPEQKELSHLLDEDRVISLQPRLIKVRCLSKQSLLIELFPDYSEGSNFLYFMKFFFKEMS